MTVLLTPDKIREMYINRNKLKQKTFQNGHFKLKYDYTANETLNRLAARYENQHFNNRDYMDMGVKRPFCDTFLEILDSFDSDKIFNLLSRIYCSTEIVSKPNLFIEDMITDIEVNRDTNELRYRIIGPEQEKDTAMLYASYAHELLHIPQLLRKRYYEYYEYSEVLSMYFEYLVYDKISHGNGKKMFLNNRIKQLNMNKSDYEDDLSIAKNNHLLEADRDLFSLQLAEDVSYYEGLEYALALIDYTNEHGKKKMGDIIYRVLYDQSSMKDEAEKLKIDTSKCSRLLKMF